MKARAASVICLAPVSELCPVSVGIAVSATMIWIGSVRAVIFVRHSRTVVVIVRTGSISVAIIIVRP